MNTDKQLHFDKDDMDIMEQNSFDMSDEDPENGQYSLDEDSEDGQNSDGDICEDSERTDSDPKTTDNTFFVHQRLHPGTNDAYPSEEKIKSIMAAYHSGDDTQRNAAQVEMIKVLSSYLIHLINTRYVNYAPNYMEDLLQEGYQGILIGMRSYDPEKGRPTTWFSRYINHEIQAYINTQINHTTSHYNAAMRIISEFIKKKENDRIPYTIRDIYLETGVPVKTIEKCLRIKQISHISYEVCCQKFPSEFGNPEDYIMTLSDKEAMRDYICKPGILSREESNCIILRYGLDGQGCRSLIDIENITSIPKYKAGKLIENALRKLSKVMTGKKEKKRVPDSIKRFITGSDLMTEEEMMQEQDDMMLYDDYL